MGIEELKSMKTQLVGCVQGQLSHLETVNTKQLGQAIDMIKDLSEAIYYCTITKAMEKPDKEKQETINNITYYTTPTKMYPDYYRDMERNNGYMYYPSHTNSTTNGNNGNVSYYNEGMMRDPREGRAALRRRMYMEGKEQKRDPNSQMKELEAYLQELSTDVTEMIKDASPEEKATLHQKMTMLANKIV